MRLFSSIENFTQKKERETDLRNSNLNFVHVIIFSEEESLKALHGKLNAHQCNDDGISHFPEEGFLPEKHLWKEVREIEDEDHDLDEFDDHAGSIDGVAGDNGNVGEWPNLETVIEDC